MGSDPGMQRAPGELKLESTLVSFSSFASTRAKRVSVGSMSSSSAVAADLFSHEEGAEEGAEEEEKEEGAEEVEEEEEEEDEKEGAEAASIVKST